MCTCISSPFTFTDAHARGPAMFTKPFTVLLLAALLSFPVVWGARSQTLFERWVTPGELIQATGINVGRF